MRSVGFGTRENKDPREGAGYYNFDQQLWRKRIGGRRRRYRQLSRSITREDERNEREGRSVCELWQVFDNVEAAPPKLRVFAYCERDVEFIVHGVSSSILLPPSIAFKVNNVIVLLNRIVEVAYADSSSKYNCLHFRFLVKFQSYARRFRINVMSKQLNTTKYSICIKTELNYGTYFLKKN